MTSENELRTFFRALFRPSTRVDRDADGRMVALKPLGMPIANDVLAKRIVRRDERGRISEILPVPVTDPIEVAACTLAAQTERRIRARVELRIPTPCDEAASTLYARVQDSIASMAAGARSVVTVSADKLPSDLNAEKITRRLAEIITRKHPDKAAHVEIVLQRTSAAPGPPRRRVRWTSAQSQTNHAASAIGHRPNAWTGSNRAAKHGADEGEDGAPRRLIAADGCEQRHRITDVASGEL